MPHPLILKVDRRQAKSAAFFMGEANRAQLDVQTYRVFGWDAEACCVSLNFAEGGDPQAQVAAVLDRLPGVMACLDWDRLTPWQHKLLLEDTEASPLVDELVWAHPRMAPLVEKHAKRVGPDARTHELTKLGVVTGRRLGFGYTQIQGSNDLELILSQGVLPMLHGAAEGNAEADRVNIVRNSFVRRNLDMLYLPMDDFPSNCVFIKGLILGLLNSVTTLEKQSVDEISCRGSGDAFCTFVIEHA